jgi:hypothetical protein
MTMSTMIHRNYISNYFLTYNRQSNCPFRWWGWALLCPRDSRLRRAYNGLEVGNEPNDPSFVEDHLSTMNLCQNPEWQYLHGQQRHLYPQKFQAHLFNFQRFHFLARSSSWSSQPLVHNVKISTPRRPSSSSPRTVL